MLLDSDNAVVALCVAGMNAEGDAAAASRLFQEAWHARTNDHEAAIAAHFVARHQDTDAERLHWNEIAVEHALRLAPAQAAPLLPSLYLNLADSLFAVGRCSAARTAIEHAEAHIGEPGEGGYVEFVRMGLRRLEERIQAQRSDSSS